MVGLAHSDFALDVALKRGLGRFPQLELYVFPRVGIPRLIFIQLVWAFKFLSHG